MVIHIVFYEELLMERNLTLRLARDARARNFNPGKRRPEPAELLESAPLRRFRQPVMVHFTWISVVARARVFVLYLRLT